MKGARVDILRYGFSMIQVETASACNMECKFCGYPLRRDKRTIMREEAVLDLIDSLEPSDGFKHLCLSHFNEPLLDKRIYKFIAYAKSRRLPVLLITNGLLFNSVDVVGRLIEAAPEYIKVSLQLLSAEGLSIVRKTGADFQRYKEGIFDLLKAAESGSSEVTLDVACNFLDGAKKMKRLLGLEWGEPSVYNTVDEMRGDIKSFLRELQNRVTSYRFDEAATDAFLNAAGPSYQDEPGLRITRNCTVKIKPFIYGRRIRDFYPVARSGLRSTENFLCSVPIYIGCLPP